MIKPRLGPMYMMGAALAFTIMIVLVKLARAELSTLEVIAWRGLVAAPIAGVLALRVGLRPHNVPILLLRSGLGFCAMALYFTAVKSLPVADLTLITRLQPMLVAILAPLFLGVDERVGWKVWGMLGVGLAGCAVLVAPELSVGGLHGLLALGATALAAGAHLCLRVLGRTDDSRVVVFWFQVLMFVLAVAGTTLLTGRPMALPSAGLMPVVVGAGVAAVVGQILMTEAYRVDRATVVAAAGYTAPLWAVIADLVVFSAIPGQNAVIGGLLVILAGIGLLFVQDRPRATTGLA